MWQSQGTAWWGHHPVRSSVFFYRLLYTKLLSVLYKTHCPSSTLVVILTKLTSSCSGDAQSLRVQESFSFLTHVDLPRKPLCILCFPVSANFFVLPVACTHFPLMLIDLRLLTLGTLPSSWLAFFRGLNSRFSCTLLNKDTFCVCSSLKIHITAVININRHQFSFILCKIYYDYYMMIMSILMNSLGLRNPIQLLVFIFGVDGH